MRNFTKALLKDNFGTFGGRIDRIVPEDDFLCFSFGTGKETKVRIRTRNIAANGGVLVQSGNYRMEGTLR
jgi:hypothetical protein